MWISSADSFYCPSFRKRRRDTSADGGEAPHRGAEPRRMYGQPAAATSAPGAGSPRQLVEEASERPGPIQRG
jgi:hypothetical protein